MKRAESAVRGLGKPRKPVVTLKQRIVRRHHRRYGGIGWVTKQDHGHFLPRLRERQRGLTPMQLLEARSHPEALFLNPLHKTPIYGGCTGTHLLVNAIAEPHVLNERQAVREIQADFDSGNAVSRN